MMRMIGWSVTTAVLIVGGVVLSQTLMRRPGAQVGQGPVVHRSVAAGPTIEQVQKLASLVTLRVPISDVQVSDLQGWTGGLRVVMAIHGDVEIATDLSTARFEEMDNEQRTAVLVLTRPSPMRPRLDHEKTRIVEFGRYGLWRFVNGQAGEEALTNNAMAHAQKQLGILAAQQDLIAQACQQTETVIGEFFGAMDWTVGIQWREPQPGDATLAGVNGPGAVDTR